MYIDTFLKSNLDILKKNIKKDWDFWGIVDGIEGVGKSSLALQIGSYLDPRFKIKNVVFTPQQFEIAVETAEKYQVIVWDEAITGTQAVDMTKMARTLKKKAVQMRQKNLFIILVLHSYFDMKKYYSIHRTWFLLHCYFVPNEKTDLFERGRFEYYDWQKKKNMYTNDKARRNYWYSEKPNFRGRFVKGYGIINEDEYRNKKMEISGEENKFTEREWVEEAFKRGMTVNMVLPYVSYSERHIHRIKSQLT